MEPRKTEIVATRIPRKLRDAMKEYIRQDTHLNEADFIRAAIREKIKSDAPHLIRIEE